MLTAFEDFQALTDSFRAAVAGGSKGVREGFLQVGPLAIQHALGVGDELGGHLALRRRPLLHLPLSQDTPQRSRILYARSNA